MPIYDQKDLFGREERLVGGYVPTHLADHLSLLALYRNTSRSSLLIEMLKEKFKNSDGTEKMTSHLANLALKEWQQRGENKGPLEDYVGAVISDLQKKKISEIHIKKIIEGIRFPHEENHKSATETK